MVLQRRLVEAGADLMAQASRSAECENALKAKLLIMAAGLNRLKGIVDLAEQFLENTPTWQALLPRYIQEKCPPQSLQYRIF